MENSDHTLNPAITRNIDAMEHRKRRHDERTSLETRVADAITAFAGSMVFVYLHLTAFSIYLAIDYAIVRFDPSLGILSAIASVEAIFLSTFVLISQNRMSHASEQRAELDLHISLLAEQELGHLAGLVAAIGDHLGVQHDRPHEIDEVRRHVPPEAVLDELEARRGEK